MTQGHLSLAACGRDFSLKTGDKPRPHLCNKWHKMAENDLGEILHTNAQSCAVIGLRAAVYRALDVFARAPMLQK